MVVVLLVLAALIALATPFLLSMRNESRATGGRVDYARARAAALGAREHARRALTQSHAAKDLTPLFDGEDELEAPPIPKDFFPANDPHGEIWSTQVEDEQGKVNLNSASPFVFGRLFGYTTITKDLSIEEAEIPVVSTDGFPATGFLWIRGELVRYLGKTTTSFLQCQRGILSDTKRFLEPQKHRQGAPVLDDRICALARWRIQEGVGYRGYDTLLSLPRAGEASVAGALPQEAFDAMLPLCTVYSERMGAGNWGAASRINIPLTAGETQNLVVANARYIAEGSTIRIWGKDGKVEYALVVQSNPGGGQVRLAAPVLHNYDAFEAQLQPLLRHPVNANTARPDLLVRLLSYLHVRQRTVQDVVTPEEAGEIVRRLVAARPIRGFQDFVLRVLRPALEDQAISPLDAQAIYRNAMQADDGGLETPTMPFSFATGDIYQISSGASINTPLGAERARAMLREVIAVAPQETLTRILGTQADFEEQMRLTRESRWWMSGPHNTSIYDAQANPPSRDVGQIQETAYQEKYFPSEDFEVSWASSQPYRKQQAGAQNRFAHFDYAWNPDGAWVDGTTWKGDPMAAPASLAAAGGLLFPGAIEAWFKPKTWNGGFFDIGGGDTAHNRIQLHVDQGNLVLRAFDEAGDDPDTAGFTEAGEIRLPLTELAGANDTWTHLSAGWRGNKPSDLLLMVDGVKRGMPRGLTQLSGTLPEFSGGVSSWPNASIPVESTDGFPDFGVVRIGGTEIVEYSSKSGNALNAAWVTGQGANKWFGGREARLGNSTTTIVGSFPQPTSVTYLAPHQKGEGVELYGYSAPLASSIPPGGATIGKLGKFSVGRLITGIASLNGGPGDTVTVQLAMGTVDVKGIKENSSTDWLLGPADGDPNFFSAFSPSGGIAMVIQFRGESNQLLKSPSGHLVGGTEFIEYTAAANNKLTGVQRGLSLSKFQGKAISGYAGGNYPASNNFVTSTGSPQFEQNTCWWVYVVPVSIRVNSTVGYDTNPGSGNDHSEYVQIFDPANDGKTEWVRYDEIRGSYLVRSDPVAIQATRLGLSLDTFDQTQLLGGTGGGNCPSSPPPPSSPGAPVPGYIGQMPLSQNVDSVVYRIWLNLNHRGVMGTYPQDHLSGGELMPVFQVSNLGPTGARPGRLDRVAVFGSNGELNAVKPWHTIQWAHVPDILDMRNNAPNCQVYQNRIYVAFRDQVGIPVAPNLQSFQNFPEDPRQLARIVKFPSGELPKGVNTVLAGSSIDGASPKIDGQVDEIEFLSGTVPGGALAPASLGSFVLMLDLPESATSLTLAPQTIRYPHRDVGYTTQVLPALPKDGGLLRIDDEILGYIECDAVSGVVTLSPTGRGMLHTEPAAHGVGTSVQFLDQVRASELTAGLSPYSLAIPVEDPSKFSPEGTLLVDKELIHYTAKAGGVLWMPGRKMEEPDKEYKDKEEGIFRGRYGTPPAAHAAGTLAVHFPIRFWDRAPQRSDCAELSFFGAHVDAPGGWFQTLYWEEDPSLRDPFVHLEALARVDDWASWDAEPGVAPGLYLFDAPTLDGGKLHRIDRGGNRLELRFYTRYLPGAYDAINFQSHSWKRAPHIKKIAIEYQAPSQVLWRGESRW